MPKRTFTTETTKDTSNEQNIEIKMEHTRTGRTDETVQWTNLEEPHRNEGSETEGESDNENQLTTYCAETELGGTLLRGLVKNM